MGKFIALLRGINFAGAGTLPMKELVVLLESLGATNARTYIQSGNAVFELDGKAASTGAGKKAFAVKLTAAIDKKRGFAPLVLILDANEFARLAAANPYSEAEPEPKSLHLFFLTGKPAAANLKSLEPLRSPTERYELHKSVLFLHAPDGIGRSKLAANVERKLGVPITARNWRTVCKLLEIACA
jgi:uncharacterized protein (DUF1697 family)